MNLRTEPASEPDPLRLRADDDAAGARLDAYLARRLPQYSRSRLQEWIRAGRVQVDGTAGRSKRRLRGGEILEVCPAAAQPATLEAADIPLDILHRDDDRGQIGALSTSQFLGLAGVAVATVALAVLARRRRSDP